MRRQHHHLTSYAALWGYLLLMLFALGTARADIPQALYDNLGLDRNADPKALFEALEQRYYDPEQGAGKGKFGELWEPIPFSKYLNPHTFYEPPQTLQMTATRQQCIDCHSGVTPGWVHSWGNSVHANLEQIRQLPGDDPRAYKKDIITEVEDNLRSMGKLAADMTLAEVSCIDCHIDIGAQQGDHAKELRMPDGAVCGTCHLQQWAERESERDTLDWPHDQWPAGRPSHALDYRANVETAIWAGMPQREIAEGCTFCHNNQTKCDTCHTRHEFSTVEARKPEACATCHNGVDHNEYENFLLSKHGTIYQTRGDSWDWNVRLADAVEQGQQAPTCQLCHMEYQGEFSHNVVRKVRWGFNPMPAIADNLDHPWFEDRQAAWQETCSTCHSPRFAQAYLEFIDNGVKDGLAVEQDAKKVLTKLYDDGLLPGQQDNRPPPPAPEQDAPGGFFQLVWAEGNNPSAVERIYAEMWEQDLLKHYKGLAHVNPGGYTYSEGWSQLLKASIDIRDADTQLREKAALKARVARLEAAQQQAVWRLDSPAQQASAGGLGLVLLGAGIASLLLARRRRSAS